MREDGFWLLFKEKPPSEIKSEVEPKKTFGEMSINLHHHQENKEIKITNHCQGTLLTYHTNIRNQNTKTIFVNVFIRNQLIQTVLFNDRSQCGIIETIEKKNLKDFIINAFFESTTGLLVLKWNRKQKFRRTFLVIKYENKEM